MYIADSTADHVTCMLIMHDDVDVRKKGMELEL